MSRRACPSTLSLVASLALVAVPAGALPRGNGPTTVSPAGRTSSACPTFSWSTSPTAAGYELVVFALQADGEVADDPVLRTRLPAGVQSWTPPGDRCLEPGERYAWSIRVAGETASATWSSPAVIEISTAPSVEDVSRALETLERFVATRGELQGSKLSALLDDLDGPGSQATEERGDDGALLPTTSTSSRLGTLTGERPEAPINPRTDELRLASPVGPPSAALLVRGEIRTIDGSGQPRLWGRGRVDSVVYEPALSTCSKGGVKFGLSGTSVDWGSAADACTIGTWVCTEAERGLAACDTARPDSPTIDYANCSGAGVNSNPNEHIGWLADRGATLASGRYLAEDGTNDSAAPCFILPVWCCWN